MTKQISDIEIEEAREKAKKYLYSKFNLNYFDVEDALQNALIKAYKNLDSFKNESSFSTWFISIAKNEALSILSKNQKFKQVEDSDFYLKKYSNTSGVDPEVYSIDNSLEIKSKLNKAALFLSKNQKEVLDLILKKSFTHRQISQKLNIPINSVRTRLFYAKKRLKKIISSHAFDPKS